MNRKKGLVWLMLLMLLPVLAGCAAGSGSAAKDSETEKAAGLTFSAAELTGEPTLVDWTQDGTAMQLLARKDEKGDVRLAFNTCQSCGGSPYAWFEYIGNNTLQCQNCGLTFPLDTVGTTKAAGCNPVTITDFTVEGDEVTVPEKLLAENVSRFTNWKKVNP